jgi:hypothetical protein
MPAMTTRLILSCVAILASVAIVPPARGEWIHSVGRYLGVGWSDGYHSHTACPPKRALKKAAAPAGPPPWWTIPADAAEPLPHPAAKRPISTSSPPTTGQSLFRQPGEGS